MAKAQPVRFDGIEHWLSLARAAEELGSTKRKVASRAAAGELRAEGFDKYGMPLWIAAAEVIALRLANKEKARAKAQKARPRTKSAKQQEREWAAESASRAYAPRDGPFVDMHLRLTLPDPARPKDEDL